IALGWIGATIALGSVVRKPNSSCSPSTGALFGPLTPRQGVHRPAKAKSGLSSARANQMGILRGFVSAYWGRRPIRVKAHGSVLHAMLRVSTTGAIHSGSPGAFSATVCIARKVIPRVRAHVYCVQYATP